MPDLPRERLGGVAVAGRKLAGALVSLSLVLGCLSGAAADDARPLQSKSEVEALLNPFGDPWRLRTDNPDIAIVTSFGCYRRLPAEYVRPTDAQNRFAATFSSRLVFGECSPVMDISRNVARQSEALQLEQLIVDIKTYNPQIRYLGYYAIAGFSAGTPGYEVLDRRRRDWFVHRKDDSSGELLRFRKGAFVVNITNEEFQDFVSEQIGQSLDEYGMDGFLADGVKPSLRQVADPHQVPDAIEAGWAEGWRSLLAKVKASIGDKLIIANISEDPVDFIGEVLDVIDGVMLEDPFGPTTLDLEASGIRARFERIFAIAAAKDKYVVSVVNTNVNRTNFQTTSAEQEHRFARYYLAAYLMFRSHEKQLLQYYTPNSIGPQFMSQAFFTDWNLRIGKPRVAYSMPAERVYRRDFDHGVVFLNNSPQPFEVAFDACCAMFTPEGERIARYSVPPSSGMIFVDAAPPAD